ncbi:MAG: hypothetical protein WC045_02395 [Patescibacteria group bacterium]
MKNVIHFEIKKDGKWFSACSTNHPIFTQGKDLTEAISRVLEATALYVDGEDLEKLGFTRSPSVTISMPFDSMQENFRVKNKRQTPKIKTDTHTKTQELVGATSY